MDGQDRGGKLLDLKEEQRKYEKIGKVNIRKREGRMETDTGWQKGEVISPSPNLVLSSRSSSRAYIPLGSKYWLSSEQLVSIAWQTKLLCARQAWKASVCTSSSELKSRQPYSLWGSYTSLFSSVVAPPPFLHLPFSDSSHQANYLDCTPAPLSASECDWINHGRSLHRQKAQTALTAGVIVVRAHKSWDRAVLAWR